MCCIFRYNTIPRSCWRVLKATFSIKVALSLCSVLQSIRISAVSTSQCQSVPHSTANHHDSWSNDKEFSGPSHVGRSHGVILGVCRYAYVAGERKSFRVFFHPHRCEPIHSPRTSHPQTREVHREDPVFFLIPKLPMPLSSVTVSWLALRPSTLAMNGWTVMWRPSGSDQKGL